MKQTEEFRTTSLHLSTFLVTQGYKLVFIDKFQPDKTDFIFEREDRLDESMSNFWKKEARVEPIANHHAEKYIKG